MLQDHNSICPKCYKLNNSTTCICGHKTYSYVIEYSQTKLELIMEWDGSIIRKVELESTNEGIFVDHLDLCLHISQMYDVKLFSKFRDYKLDVSPKSNRHNLLYHHLGCISSYYPEWVREYHIGPWFTITCDTPIGRLYEMFTRIPIRR
jgi:hypothetical protein